MIDPQYLSVVAWAGLALLLLLCLPFAGISKFVLEVSALALRLGLLALIAGAAYLWFRPAEVPAQVPDTLNSFPRLREYLPDPASQYFGVCVAALIVIAMLPMLAVLDVTRRLAGRRLHRLRTLAVQSAVVAPPAAEPAAAVQPAVEAPPAGEPAPVVRRVDRRGAAKTLAEVGTRKPVRLID
jgi:hypothetical protein